MSSIPDSNAKVVQITQSPHSQSVNRPNSSQDQDDIIESLRTKLRGLDLKIAAETKRQKKRLDEEHEIWAPLIMDARSRLGSRGSGSGSQISQEVANELASLEREENEARIEIRRQSKKRVEGFEEQKKVVEGDIAKLESVNASVWIIVPDVLIVIFQFYVEDIYEERSPLDSTSDPFISLAPSKFPNSPWILTQVCSKWRQVAFDTPTLWSRITITSNIDAQAQVNRWVDGKEVCNSLPRLERALERVGRAPIDLDIVLDWSYDTLSIDVIEEMILTVLGDHTKGKSQDGHGLASQWRTLYLQNSELVIPSNHIFDENRFQWSQRTFPHLTRVDIRMQHHDSTLASKGLLPFFPLLEAIQRTSISPSLSHLPIRLAYSFSPTFRPLTISPPHSNLMNSCLQSIHLHACGKNMVKNSITQIEIGKLDDLILVAANPQNLVESYTVLLQCIPKDISVRRYLSLLTTLPNSDPHIPDRPFAANSANPTRHLGNGDAMQRARARWEKWTTWAQRQTSSFDQNIVDFYGRLSIHYSIPHALSDHSVRSRLSSLRSLQIITTNGLGLGPNSSSAHNSSPFINAPDYSPIASLYLPFLKDLVVYTSSLDGLQYLRAPKLDSLKIGLIPPKHVQDERETGILISLSDLWDVNQDQPLNTKTLILEGVTILPGTLSLIMDRMPELRSIILRNPNSHFEMKGSSSGSAETIVTIHSFSLLTLALEELVRPLSKLNLIYIGFISTSFNFNPYSDSISNANTNSTWLTPHQRETVYNILTRLGLSMSSCDSITLQNGDEVTRIRG